MAVRPDRGSIISLLVVQYDNMVFLPPNCLPYLIFFIVATQARYVEQDWYAPVSDGTGWSMTDKGNTWVYVGCIDTQQSENTGWQTLVNRGYKVYRYGKQQGQFGVSSRIDPSFLYHVHGL